MEYLQQEQQRQNQAKHISAWVDKEEFNRKGMKGPTAIIAVLNQSFEPIYQVTVSIVAFQGSGSKDGKNTPSSYRGFLSIIPPKSKVLVEVDGGYHGMSFHPAVEIAFTDRSNQSWIRKSDGNLLSIEVPSIEYYKIPKPVSWQLPKTTIFH